MPISRKFKKDEFLKIRITVKSEFYPGSTETLATFSRTAYGKIVLGEVLRFLCEEFLHIEPSRDFTTKNPSAIFFHHKESGVLLPSNQNRKLLAEFPEEARQSIINLADGYNLTDLNHLREFWQKNDPAMFRNYAYVPAVSAADMSGKSGGLYIYQKNPSARFWPRMRGWILSERIFVAEPDLQLSPQLA